ncbi:hypothetical protein [Streptomyces sp. NBC_01594]
MRRLLALRGEQKLTTGHVRLVAEALQMTERTVRPVAGCRRA